VNDLKVIFSESIDSPSHLAVDLLWVSVVCKICVIREDLDGNDSVCEERSPLFEAKDKGSELSIPNIIILFCLIEGSRGISNHPSFPAFISLKQHCSEGVLGGVHFKFEGSIAVCSCEFWVFTYPRDQCVEALPTFLGPDKWLSFLG
jgi:hypothetical protein